MCLAWLWASVMTCTCTCDGAQRPGLTLLCVYGAGPVTMSTQVCVSTWVASRRHACSPSDFPRLYPSDLLHPRIYPKPLCTCFLPGLASMTPRLKPSHLVLPSAVTGSPPALLTSKLISCHLSSRDSSSAYFTLRLLVFLLMAPKWPPGAPGPSSGDFYPSAQGILGMHQALL